MVNHLEFEIYVFFNCPLYITLSSELEKSWDIESGLNFKPPWAAGPDVLEQPPAGDGNLDAARDCKNAPQ